MAPSHMPHLARSLRRVALTLAACFVASTWLVVHPGTLAAAEKPNIVMFYLDDVAPHDGSLWDDPTRTPAIYNTFIAHGIHFTDSYGEDSLCCPGRASILTGLHTQNNGVDANDARLFSPQESVAGAMQGAGYTTIWIGKYMNRNTFLSPAAWAAHLAPWDVFDGIYGLNGGDFYNYTLRTKDQGDIKETNYHSTQMIMDRAVSRFAAAPADKPIFAILSIYDLHAPNIPLPITAQQSAECANFPPYDPPSYNEADVSDKPNYIKNLPLLPYANGWPMETYCREMFGVDKVVQRVTDELSAEGRLNNTLLVFTADNGMSWGAHRRGQQKDSPDATALPLYMAWPAGWGTSPRTITDWVSNIDLAPTFCELGGCTLGPYPTGQSGPDGLSLVSMIANGTPLGRTGILEQSPLGQAATHVPPWATIRTTSENPLGQWRYTEYADGERELYDETNDPYELNNVASEPSHSVLEAALSQQLVQLLNAGRVNRPDLSLFGKKQKMFRYYAGYDRFDSTATPEQTLSLQVASNTLYSLLVNLRNNEISTDSFTVTANVVGGEKVHIQWLLGGVDVTSRMASGGVQVNLVPRDQTHPLTLKVTTKAKFPKTWVASIDIHAVSQSDSSKDDDVLLVLHK